MDKINERLVDERQMQSGCDLLLSKYVFLRKNWRIKFENKGNVIRLRNILHFANFLAYFSLSLPLLALVHCGAF